MIRYTFSLHGVGRDRKLEISWVSSLKHLPNDDTHNNLLQP